MNPATNAARRIDTVVFDLGNVLIPWDPRRLYRKLFATEPEVEHFLTEICPMSWHSQQDGGRALAEATAERLALFPQHETLIRAFYDRIDEMFDVPIEGSVALLQELKAKGYRLYALTNWPAEMFPAARRDYPFLAEFEGILVSGEEKLVKPDPAIYHLLFKRFAIDPARAVFMDDSPANVQASLDVGMAAIHFQSPEQTRAALRELGVEV